jgi:hypothetical protein
MENKIQDNKGLPLLVNRVANWHIERNLINGATAWAQTSKLLEEFTELVAAQLARESDTTTADDVFGAVAKMLTELHDNARIKPVRSKDADDAMKDAIGDMAVVQINLAEREYWSLESCLEASFKEIEHRKGKMIDGVYVKEADLN